MLKIERYVTMTPEQMDIVIEGMRNPMNSWDRSDTDVNEDHILGPNDADLAKRLAKGGPVHAKYRRMMPVWATITAPLYWWKEFDTYKVGTVANSCSTMHKIHEKKFTIEDFSCEHLINEPLVELEPGVVDRYNIQALSMLEVTIAILNAARLMYIKTNDKKYWWQMIQLLPSSYNQKRTVFINYETMVNILTWRRDHKLDEWHTFCEWLEGLPYVEDTISI